MYLHAYTIIAGMADLVNRYETPIGGPTQKPCLCFFNVYCFYLPPVFRQCTSLIDQILNANE